MPLRNEKNPLYKYKESDLKSGISFTDEHGKFKIMAVVDGYVMFRRKGAHPTCCAVKVFLEKINYIPAV